MATDMIELESITCYGCNDQMQPMETDWELFRYGIHVHNKDLCRDKFSAKIAEYNDTREPVDFRVVKAKA